MIPLCLIILFEESPFTNIGSELAGSIVRDWQIFGHGSDFPTWSEVGTKSRAKVPNFRGNFEPSYLWTGKSF